ncbi:MAG: hypothetical protein HND57_11240 [Planctomycetes bacterium]|nr:hypothetical protein [Planctomycetota bacterium]
MLNTATALHARRHVHLVARIGEHDEDGQWVQQQATALGMAADWLADESTITTQKMRVVAEPTGDYLARLDHEIVAPLSASLEQRLHERIQALVPEVDVVVVSDYAKGFVSQEVAGLIVQVANRAGVPVVVDGKPCTIPWYAGATVFTPNVTEAQKLAVKLGIGDSRGCTGVGEVVSMIGPGLAARLQGSVLITCGADGMYLFPGGHHIPAAPPVDAAEVGTTSGAGDIVTAVLACEWLGAGDVG